MRNLYLAALVVAVMNALVAASGHAWAQASFDRPGGDYARLVIDSGDPAECAMKCEGDRRCRAWSFNYPSEQSENAVCWLKNTVPARVASTCCISGVRGAGVVEPFTGQVEQSTDRYGGDFRSFDIKPEDKKPVSSEQCRQACQADSKCRAWTYARPGYVGRAARCFLKNDIKPPHRKPGFSSGVVR